MINIYRSHIPDERFSSNFQCKFRKCYPLQILFDFKSMGHLLGFQNLSTNVWDKPRSSYTLALKYLFAGNIKRFYNIRGMVNKLFQYYRNFSVDMPNILRI